MTYSFSLEPGLVKAINRPSSSFSASMRRTSASTLKQNSKNFINLGGLEQTRQRQVTYIDFPVVGLRMRRIFSIQDAA